MTTLYLDYETRSKADLRKVGIYRYVEDPSFKILMAGWAVDTGPIRVAVGESEIRDIPGLLDPGVLHVAHNAAFERVVTGTLLGAPMDPSCWCCTSVLAAEYGYPTSLEGAAQALEVTEKDSAGSRLIKLFTRPNRDGSWNTSETHPLEWLEFCLYCVQDVETLMEVHAKLGTWPTPGERRVWVADQRINDRGMAIDLELCKFAARAVEENRETNKEKFREITGVENPASQPQVMAWAADVGLGLPNLRAETIQAAIDDPETSAEHREVLELRQDLALAAGGKFAAALDVVSPDSRIRGGFRFFGAHTGRWTGQRVQPQNLPRATVDDPEAAILDLKLGLGASPYTLKALVRSMFVGPFTVVDYAAIEARVLAWMAGEEWALQAFRDGRDIYVETAERMSTPGNTLTRFQGKVACIAAGSKVLTDQGIVAIEDVTTNHLVWDGEEWVAHDGLVFRGYRDVVTYDGLTATPDHIVWVEGSAQPVRLDHAAACGSRLQRSEHRGRPLRVGQRGEPGATIRARLEQLPRSNEVQRLRVGAVAVPGEPDVWSFEGLPAMLSAPGSRSADASDVGRSAEQVPEPGGPVLRGVWGSRDRVPVLISGRGSALGYGEARPDSGGPFHRPGGQRRPLRAGEHPLGDPKPADEQSASDNPEGVSSGALALCGGYRPAQAAGREVAPGDRLRGPVGSGGTAEGLAGDREKVAVYDLVNAGPRQRFTVSGVLVHNCLALGYNGSVGSLRAMGAEGDDEDLLSLVTAWRRANARIVHFWRKMDDALESGGQIGKHVHVNRSGGDMEIQLPSGRAIGYHGVKWRRYSVTDPKTGKKVFKQSWVYRDPKRGGATIGTYGGRLTENVTQAIARDILAEALVRLEDAGYRTVGHVHDEAIVESDELEDIKRIMTQVPTWATGLPLDGEGFVTERYRKG